MKKNIFFLSLLSIILFIPGCLDPVDLEIDRNVIDEIVVQGRIQYSETSTSVLVSLNTAYTFGTPRSVEARLIELIDEDGNSMELPRVATGRYFIKMANEDFPIDISVGRSYQVKFSTFDGQQIESAFEKIPTAPEVGELSYEIISKDRETNQGLRNDQAVRFNYTSNTKDGDDDLRLNFFIVRDYRTIGYSGQACYSSEVRNRNRVSVFSGEEFSREKATVPVFDEFIGSVFAHSYWMTLTMEKISAEAYEYFANVKRLVQPSETIFKEPSAKIIGNFTNKTDPNRDVYGYFYATQVDFTRIFVDSSDVGNPPILCSQPAPQYPPDLCTSCMSAAADTVKPAFFTD